MTATQPLSLPQQVASQAELIVNSLRDTHYQHQDHIDVDRGIYDCDCNGFASFVLERAAPGHYGMLPKEPTQPRPRAFEYYVFFSALTRESADGWRRIDRLSAARRGDIIVWRFPKVEPHHDTGHVVLLAETPSVDDTGNFAVRVYDSAAAPHFDDTRGNQEGQFPSGIGSGFINFTVDDMGRPTAFQFGPSEDKFTTLPIAIGRLEPLPPAIDS